MVEGWGATRVVGLAAATAGAGVLLGLMTAVAMLGESGEPERLVAH